MFLDRSYEHIKGPIDDGLIREKGRAHFFEVIFKDTLIC